MADTPGISRYHRQMILPEVGAEGQRKISDAKVLVVGAGALGAAVLLYLVPAGVGTVGVLDNDELEVSNLHRQVLYGMSDVNKPKVVAAIERLEAMNPDVDLVPHFLHLNVNNALEIIRKYDLVIECSDNFPTKFLVNDACIMLGKPCVIGAAIGFSGQLSVYNYRGGPTYRCLLSNPPDPLTLPTCANAGVMGMVPGIIGNLQALEAIKIIMGRGDVLSGRLLHFEGLDGNFIEVPIEARAENKQITELTEYAYSCPDFLLKQHTVLPGEFFAHLEDQDHWEVLALSDDQDFLSIKNYRWETLPLYKLPEAIQKVAEHKKVMLVCENGIKTLEALKYLLVKENFNRAWSLKDGLSALRFQGLD